MKKIISLVGIGILVGVGFVAFTPAKSTCVNLVVDYGSLDSGSVVEKCIETSGEISALDLMANAKIEVQGTDKYGTAVVCRLNNLPDASVESCAEMPPAEAYWAVYVKEHELFPIPFNTEGEWGWAQTGFDEVHLHNGDSLGLVFIENGEVRYP
jgi:hypothetical protein